MLNLRSLLEGVPSILQYVIVLALVMVLLYVALLLTRRIGAHFTNSKKITYDDPEKYADSVPDLFATTEFRRGRAKGEAKAPEDDSRDQDRDLDSDSDRD